MKNNILNKIIQNKKVIVINISLLAFFLGAPPFLLGIYKIAKNKPQNVEDIISEYPSFANQIIAKKIREDHHNTDYKYMPFVGWKPIKTNRKYLKVGGPYSTRMSLNNSIDKSAWFFGGSTMYGLEAKDDGTIPSKYAVISNKKVMNFGVPDWNSRQSLNQLINIIGDGHVPNKIIFYDGVNDVLHGCKDFVIDIPTHSNEDLIRKKLSKQNDFSSYLKDKSLKLLETIKSPYVVVFDKFFSREIPPIPVLMQENECINNPRRAEDIAKHLINNWHLAFLIAENKGAQFLGVLQPTIFTSSSPIDYMRKIDKHFEHKAEFLAVYEAIRNQIKEVCKSDKEFCNSLVDASNWLNVEVPVFTDFVHISETGNLIIANKINSQLSKD